MPAREPAEARALSAAFLRPRAHALREALCARGDPLRDRAGRTRRTGRRGVGRAGPHAGRIEGHGILRLCGRLRWGPQHRAPAAGHRDAGQPGAHLHDQRDHRVRRAGAPARQAARVSLHLHRARRHLVDGRRDQRAELVALLHRRRSDEARAGRGRDPGAVLQGGRPQRLRLPDPVGDAVVASATDRRRLRVGPRLSRGRLRASDLADRRVRHEHRAAGLGRPVVEARRDDRGLGRGRVARVLRARAAPGGDPQHRGGDGQPQADARSPGPEAAARSIRARSCRGCGAAGVRRCLHGDDEAGVVHDRHPPRLSVRGVTDHRA